MKYVTAVIFISLGFCLTAQNIPGVDKPGSYAKTAATCYKTFYNEPEKLDTLTRPEGMISQRIWRIIDLKSPGNQFMNYNQPKTCQFDLWEILRFGLKTGKINAFRSDNFSSAQANLIPKKEVLSMMRVHDTITETVFDSEGNETKTEKVRDEDISSASLSGYIVCEDWYFDSHWAKADKRIVCIAPIFFDDKQQKEKPLFYLYYNECRNLLSSYQVPLTDPKDSLTYDKLFLKRKFEFYVMKKTNVFNRSVNDYSKGKTIEYESDKTIRELLSKDFDQFEH
ncbi:MAG: gliding motility protein GldN [Bacteroidetes bacterium]|nr:gliding motility protein GldN [Bacteroidota bacterium]